MTTTTSDPESTRALADAFATRATDYVRTKFAAFSLERFSTTDAAKTPSRSAVQSIGAGALLGVLFAAAVIALLASRAVRRTTSPPTEQEQVQAPAADLSTSRTKKAASGGQE